MAPTNSPQGSPPQVDHIRFQKPLLPCTANRLSWEIAARRGLLLLVTNLPSTQTCNEAEDWIRRILGFYNISEPTNFFCHQKKRYHRRRLHTHEGWIYVVMPDRVAVIEAQHRLDDLMLFRGRLKAVLARKHGVVTQPVPKLLIWAPENQLTVTLVEHGNFIPGAYDGHGATGYTQPTCESVVGEMDDYVVQKETDGVCRVVESDDVKDIRAAMGKMGTQEDENVSM